MTARPTLRFGVHVALAAVGLLGAVVVRTPELVVVAAPSLALVALDIGWRAPEFRAGLRIDPGRIVEDDHADVEVAVDGPAGTTVQVTVDLPSTLRANGPTRWTVTLDGEGGARLHAAVTAVRWGAARVGPVRLVSFSPGGLLASHTVVRGEETVRVLPPIVSATTLTRPARTHAGTGNRTSRARGSGTEFAELRPYVPGDRARDLSWRASARRGRPWVTDRHPDRRVDIVLLVDAYDPDHLDDVLRAALSLAEGYLAGHDRVGVTTLGGVMRWLEPGAGAAHRVHIAEALLDTRVLESYATPRSSALSARVIPPRALVVAVTPATDPRLVTVAAGLRARGRDVVAVVLEPAPPPAVDHVGELANRLLALQRRATRERLHVRSLPAVGWDPSTPVDEAMAELRRWRQRRGAVAP